MEVEALATITEKNMQSFVWRNIICRYGIPRVLILDNGKQFDNASLKDVYSQLGIKNHYSSPSHPQANGQVEVSNRSLLKIIKTWLEGAYMVVRVAKCFMGIQDDGKNAYRRDTISASIRERDHYPS